MKILRIAVAAVSFQALVCQAEENSIDYSFVSRGMLIMKAEKKGNLNCVPFYLKSSLKDQPLDPVKANFHLKSKDGETLTLKIEPFKPTPKFAASEKGKKAIEGGYTHIIWIPKGLDKFQGGLIIHSLPKGSVDMAYIVMYSSDDFLSSP